jgi:hypothetical protein
VRRCASCARRRYALYRGGDGQWALGARAWEGTGFGAPQPAVGPLAAHASGGLAVRALDASGAPVAAPADAHVAGVEAMLRAERGAGARRWTDSAHLVLRLRGTAP